MTEALRAQLIALRAQLLASLALVDLVLGPDEAEIGNEVELRGAALARVPRDVCDHPADKRDPAPVPGHLDRFLCKACHQIIEEAA